MSVFFGVGNELSSDRDGLSDGVRKYSVVVVKGVSPNYGRGFQM